MQKLQKARFPKERLVGALQTLTVRTNKIIINIININNNNDDDGGL